MINVIAPFRGQMIVQELQGQQVPTQIMSEWMELASRLIEQLASGEIGGDYFSSNYLINANLNTTIINQKAFAGGQPAINVYGYDMWRGDPTGTQIRQTVENSEVINEAFTISWVGGTGTAEVDGVSGLVSGSTFTLSTSTDFNVTVPTDATYIHLQKGSIASPFPSIEEGSELAKCQRHYWQGSMPGLGVGFMYAGVTTGVASGPAVSFPVTMRAQPNSFVIITTPTYNSCSSGGFTYNKDGATERLSVTAGNAYSATSGIYAADANFYD